MAMAMAKINSNGNKKEISKTNIFKCRFGNLKTETISIIFQFDIEIAIDINIVI